MPGARPAYHTIELTVDLKVALGRSPRQRLEPATLRRGTRLPARLRPHVVESDYGPVEVADLLLADDTALCDVSFGCFRFPD
jgi:hypothetical protein